MSMQKVCKRQLTSISSLSGTPLGSKVSASYIWFMIPFVNFDEKIQQIYFHFSRSLRMATGCPRLKTWIVASPRYRLLIRARRSRAMALWPSPLTNFPKKCQKKRPPNVQKFPLKNNATAYWYGQEDQDQLTKYSPKTPPKCPKIAQKITLPPIDMAKKIKGNGAMAFIID